MRAMNKVSLSSMCILPAASAVGSLCLLLLCGLPAVNAAGKLQTSIGIDYSTGDYGESVDTDMVYAPLTLKYSEFPWSFKATLPYLSISGPASAIGGSEGIEFIPPESDFDFDFPFPGLNIPDDTTEDKRVTSGLGDLLLSAGWALDTLWDSMPFVDLTGKIKLPTADESKGLGSGELDLQLQLDFAYVLGPVTPLFTLGYKWPGYEGFGNQRLVSAGFDLQTAEQHRLGLLFDYRDPATDTSSPRREWMIYHNFKISTRYSLMSYWVSGQSDNSPDQGMGFQLSIRQ